MQGSLIYSIQLKFHHRRLNEWWMKDECNPEQKSLSEKNEISFCFCLSRCPFKVFEKVFLSDGGEKNFIGTKDWKKQSELDGWIKLKLNAEGSNPPRPDWKRCRQCRCLFADDRSIDSIILSRRVGKFLSLYLASASTSTLQRLQMFQWWSKETRLLSKIEQWPP